MASVHIDLVPPDQPGLVKLHIYEAPSATGPWALVETVTEVGSHPNYISRYTTDNAVNFSDWFAVEWEDDKGATTGISNGVQGGTSLLMGTLVQRVLTSDPSLPEIIVTQESEAVVSTYFGVEDPYSVESTSYRILSGLTYLVLARSYLRYAVQSTMTSEDYTAGLITQKSSSGSSKSARSLLDDLLAQAARDLGVGRSVILQMAEIEVGAGWQLTDIDQSRLIVEIS